MWKNEAALGQQDTPQQLIGTQGKLVVFRRNKCGNTTKKNFQYDQAMRL